MTREDADLDLSDLHAFLREGGHGIPALFIDSNVLNEISTTVDLAREVSRQQQTRGLLRGMAEVRRRWARGSLWLMLALDSASTVTLSLQEPARFWQKHGAVGIRDTPTWNSEWFLAFFEFIRPHVVPRWDALMWPEQTNGRSASDTFIAELCRVMELPLVTRDAGLTAKAQRRGVAVFSPEQWAERILDADVARERFFERFDRYAIEYLVDRAKRVSVPAGVLAVHAREVRRVYEFVWSSGEPDGAVGAFLGRISKAWR